MMETPSQPLLSLCIPTYNRCVYLRQALDALVVNPAFDDEVEVVISDNASSDETEQVCREFVDKYPNINYFRNDQNVRDRNFGLALDRSSGQYCKLMNDNHIISGDGLPYLKETVRMYSASRTPLFFTNGVLFNRDMTDECRMERFEDIVVFLSHYVTAIYCFGAWREDWMLVKDRFRYSDFQLNQEDWAYQIMELHGEGVLGTREFFQSLDLSARQRSGYNWFKVHVENYYTILQSYVDKGLVSHRAMSQEHRTFLKTYHAPIVQALLYNPFPEWQFDMSGAGKILWKFFKKEFFFYPYMATLPVWGSAWLLKQRIK